MRVNRHFSAARGFSLVEITIALGIVAFALVAIMGLFPVAMKNATDSQAETRATFIAQSIFSDLQAGPSSTNTFLTTNASLSQPARINLKTASTQSVRYSEDGTPGGANPLYEARIFITPNPALTNLSRVEIQMESPVGAANRTRFNFVTLMPNNRERQP